MAERFILIAKKTGQLGNRLTVHAHWMGAARERGWTLLNPSLDEYAGHFPGPRARLARCDRLPSMQTPTETETPVPAFDRRVAYAASRIVYKLARVAQHVSFGVVAWARAQKTHHYDIEGLLDRIESRGCRLLVAQGYHFRQHRWAARHGDAIRRFFMPSPEHVAAAEQAIAALRAEFAGDGRGEVIGVHIRHGDYRQHLGGRFFYEVGQYAALMRRCRDLLAPRPVAFLICSNASHASGDFADLRHGSGPGHLVGDLHALSLCDRLIGPPSSFSSWAAFHGRVLHYVVEDPAREFSLADFRLYPSPDPLY